jgi:2'-5' RNA ligase
MKKAYIYAPLPQAVHHYFPKDRGGDDDSEPHCTILYVGEIQDSLIPKLKQILDEATSDMPPIKCSFGQLKSFPGGEYGVPWYVEIDADQALEQLHKSLWKNLENAGIDVQHRFKNYKPHATLKYLPEGKKYSGDIPVGDFSISVVELDIQ